MFDPDYYEGPWRRLWHTRLRGDLYPNHGFGPVANYMDVNRGDRVTHISSFGTPSLGLAEYREANMPPGDPSWKETYIESDRTISLVQTAKGRVIRLEHDVSTPHPYSRINSLGGTKGVFEDYPERIYIEPDHTDDAWGDFGAYADWDHWLWKEHSNPPGGHGGMDYIMLFRLMQCMRLGLVPDFDVYDAATWTAPVPLSHCLHQGARGAAGDPGLHARAVEEGAVGGGLAEARRGDRAGVPPEDPLPEVTLGAGPPGAFGSPSGEAWGPASSDAPGPGAQPTSPAGSLANDAWDPASSSAVSAGSSPAPAFGHHRRRHVLLHERDLAVQHLLRPVHVERALPAGDREDGDAVAEQVRRRRASSP